jgi:hypothetical protein
MSWFIGNKQVQNKPHSIYFTFYNPKSLLNMNSCYKKYFYITKFQEKSIYIYIFLNIFLFYYCFGFTVNRKNK